MDGPNIIIMYADDLGFGDVGCYGATGIKTPNIDRLAKSGIRFTDGHAPAATCTPSRFSLLTGKYPWRNRNAGIARGDANILIEPGSPTLPGMLKEAGYATGVVGKWHLGLGTSKINWNKEIDATPLDVGFDYSFIFPGTNDRTPCVYMEGRKVVGLEEDDPIEVDYNSKENPYPERPAGRDNPELLKMKHSHGHDKTIINGVGRIGYMRGGTKALWVDETMADTFCDKALSFIEGHKEEPFFLYYAFHQPHVPRIPAPRFIGASERGPRGDVIVEMDWCVGQVLDKLEKLGIADNTLVVFSSDNGPVLDDGYQDQAVELCGPHKPAGPLRGGKYSKFEGGTRVPFILSWPAKVKAGESSALVNHVDFMASFGSLIGADLAEGAGPDSEDVIDALLGRTDNGRTEMAVEGHHMKPVLREGSMTFIPPEKRGRKKPSNRGSCSVPQLYDLSQDIGQVRNLAPERPEVVKKMSARLKEIRG